MREILKISQLFSQLDDRSLDEITSATTLKTVARDELIFYEGDAAHAFFVVGTGKVKVFKLSPDGKEQILMIAVPGDTFAEAALFAGGKYPASAQALEDTELLVVHRDKFVSLLGRNPHLALNLIARLSELLRKLTTLVEGLSLSDVTSRLAYYLVEAAGQAEHTGELIITLPEKKSVLASQLGTIPETLSRSLAKLSRDGIIRVDGARIHVLDMGRLIAIAE
jgi:CRP/FNR family transcriptional regulator